MLITFRTLHTDGRVNGSVAIDPTTVKQVHAGPFGRVGMPGKESLYVSTSAILVMVVGRDTERLVVDGTQEQAVRVINAEA